MTATITYKQTVPRRPVLDDLHGGLIADDTEFPPDPGHPHADAMNQGDLLEVAAHNVLPHTRIYITFSGGTPTKSGVYSMRDDLTTADFTVTDNGAGDTSITHVGGKLPAATFPASVDQCDDTEIDRVRVFSIANGWRVKTKLGATGTDAAFMLSVSGL